MLWLCVVQCYENTEFYGRNNGTTIYKNESGKRLKSEVELSMEIWDGKQVH